MTEEDWMNLGQRAAAMMSALKEAGFAEDEQTAAALTLIATTIRYGMPRSDWLAGCAAMRDMVELMVASHERDKGKP